MHTAPNADLAARLIVGLAGLRPTAGEAVWLRIWQPAGVILFSRNVQDSSQLRALCTQIHALVPGARIVADHEGGPVSQLSGAVGRPPAPWALGALDDVDLTRRVHAETGRRCAALGIDRVLAPCCDVLVEPRNPVIGSRAFGGGVDLVVRHAAAAVRGLRQGGVQACVKHWPGHGGSRSDSHLGLARAGEGSLPAPFCAGLAGGADAVMVGHLWPGRGEDDGALPATLDADALTDCRSLLAAAAGAVPELWADDVTMGALRGVMASLEIQPDADCEEGMIEPEDLQVGWLRAIAEAGCDRLLVRGIPFGAFPIPDGGGAEPAAESAAEAAADGPDGEDDGAAAAAGDDPYAEAREGLRRLAKVEEFTDPSRPLLWLDLTQDDRWQAAAGQEPDSPTLAERLIPDFARVRRIGVQDLPALEQETAGRYERLLVTSHRPLRMHLEEGEWRERVGPHLEARGRALVMGHPSLAMDLAADPAAGVSGESGALLPEAWSAASLYDTMAIDYAK